MNSLFKNIQINQLSGRLRQIAGTPNVLSMQFSAVDVAGIRESIITIANECKADDPQIARQLLAAKDILFAVNQFGQRLLIHTLSGKSSSDWIILRPKARHHLQRSKQLLRFGPTYIH